MARGKGARIASWVMAGLLALVFAAAGVTKLLGAEMHKQNFARWGYPSWYLPLTGVIELGAAILVIVPRTRVFGACVLACVMLGAVATHVRAGEYPMIALPVILLGLAAVCAQLSRPTR
jgi:uncharacterized membrane protein YphA (DoxX/SURF4 family)